MSGLLRSHWLGQGRLLSTEDKYTPEELDPNSDLNGIHRALFWHELGMLKVSFLKFVKMDEQTVDANLDSRQE